MNADRFAERRRRAQATVEAEELAGLLVSPGPDLVYLTGHAPPPLERLTMLLLVAGRDPILVVPTLERALAEGSPGAGGLEILEWRDGENPYRQVARALPAGRYAVTDQTWASHLLELDNATADCLFVAAGKVLPLLRAVKDVDEVQRLRAAGRAADAAFDDVVALPFNGRRELDLAADLDRLLRSHGHQRVDFTIVGSGPNSASPHHHASERAIQPGDVVVMDFGGVLNEYCSDITRTVVVGEPDEELLRVYDVVRAAQQAAFEAIRPGVAAEEVDRAARSVISAAGYADRFVHRTGHGIGLEVHEPPYIVEGNTTPLLEGMTFSDEPGIYLEGRFGVRIEDQVVVTGSGAERLNDATRDLMPVE